SVSAPPRRRLRRRPFPAGAAGEVGRRLMNGTAAKERFDRPRSSVLASLIRPDLTAELARAVTRPLAISRALNSSLDLGRVNYHQTRKAPNVFSNCSNVNTEGRT